MLVGAVRLNNVAFPRSARRIVGPWILPPVERTALIIVTGHDIEIAIPINVVAGTARLNGDGLIFDHVDRPTLHHPAIPRDGRCLAPASDDKILIPIAIEIGHEASGLLIRAWRGR
ncbi:hypothetical protein CTKA_02772 [Chthonomonas calidirosea]|nr:hypothetical protein CTKA_02772 [Chthonomonas calidirosea]